MRVLIAIGKVAVMTFADLVARNAALSSEVRRSHEALKIAQMIQARIPADELAMENAAEVINRCQQNLNATPEPLPSPTESAPATPEPTLIPAPTP